MSYTPSEAEVDAAQRVLEDETDSFGVVPRKREVVEEMLLAAHEFSPKRQAEVGRTARGLTGPVRNT
jgi:hypothetical protein